MQCVILAAGKGVRMGALTQNTPKPMLSLLGKPMLEWKLQMLPKEVDEVILIIGYLGEQIENYFGQEWQGRKIRYVYQKDLNGTAGAVALLKDTIQDRFLITMGDDLYKPEDLVAMLHEELAVLVFEVEDATLFGILETAPDGRLLSVTERPHGKKRALINTNVFILDKRFFDYPLIPINIRGEYGLPQTVAAMSKDLPVKTVTAHAWQPVGNPEDIPLAEAFLKEHWNVHVDQEK